MVAAGKREMTPSNGRTTALQGVPRHLCGASYVPRGRGSGLPTWVQPATSRRVECGAWHERQQGCDTVQQRFDGAGTREVEEDPVLVLFDLGCHFEEG